MVWLCLLINYSNLFTVIYSWFYLDNFLRQTRKKIEFRNVRSANEIAIGCQYFTNQRFRGIIQSGEWPLSNIFRFVFLLDFFRFVQSSGLSLLLCSKLKRKLKSKSISKRVNKKPFLNFKFWKSTSDRNVHVHDFVLSNKWMTGPIFESWILWVSKP